MAEIAVNTIDTKDYLYLKKHNKWYVVNGYMDINKAFYGYPNLPGIYAIYSTILYPIITHKLVYIGTSKNLQNRLNNHEIIKALYALDFYVTVKCKVVYINQLRCLNEKRIISKLNPPANGIKYRNRTNGS